MCARADQIELAMRLKGGVLVSRAPLFVEGHKMPRESRRITIYKPHRTIAPEKIAKDVARREDPQLGYHVTGPKKNIVGMISAPQAKTPTEPMRNGIAGARIKRAFLGKNGDRLDRRGITSTAVAAAQNHETIPTPDLIRHYKDSRYVVDRGEMARMMAEARTPDHRAIRRETLKAFVPMIRRPKSPWSKTGW